MYQVWTNMPRIPASFLEVHWNLSWIKILIILNSKTSSYIIIDTLFQWYTFRKHCTNCRCGKADHNVIGDETGAADGGFYIIGRLFDRPMRTKKEELEFCYGNALEDEDDLLSRSHGILRDPEDSRNGTKKTPTAKKVKFDWIPENVSDRLARKYLNQIPESAVPIAGSEAAQFRQQVSIPIETLLRMYYSILIKEWQQKY